MGAMFSVSEIDNVLNLLGRTSPDQTAARRGLMMLTSPIGSCGLSSSS